MEPVNAILKNKLVNIFEKYQFKGIVIIFRQPNNKNYPVNLAFRLDLLPDEQLFELRDTLLEAVSPRELFITDLNILDSSVELYSYTQLKKDILDERKLWLDKFMEC